MQADKIYKIVDEAEWTAAVEVGWYAGAPIDLQDGYIHFSTAAQVAETAAKHFAGRDGLLLVEVDATVLGDALKWEPSRGGDLFPHLYDKLSLTAVTLTAPMPIGENGQHELPDWCR